jgi:2-dehydropantoate 2-reductase
LRIEGKSIINVKIDTKDSINNINFFPDLLILTVKSYDTESAIKQVKKIIGENTIVLSLQNGLSNIDVIKNVIGSDNIIAGVTTHGAYLSKPGLIKHTGQGSTMIGELNCEKTNRLKQVVDLFNNSGIQTNISENIIREIWIKAIINSSINPLTTIFICKNGYLIKNPILEKIVENICNESTSIANAMGFDLLYDDIIKITKDVIIKTSDNYSSMLESYKNGKKTEIDAINGKLIKIGKMYNADTILNELLLQLVKSCSIS